ncbi:MAG: hypothetical protein IJ608_12880 [Lachnospiraceae bacterium]|nr:hypothetical protein [Lachnospiraceae bacterium]
MNYIKKLSPVHIGAALILIFTAIGLLFSKDRFQYKEASEGDIIFPMMENGNYSAVIDYKNGVPNMVLKVVLEKDNGKNNEMGLTVAELPVEGIEGTANIEFSLEKQSYFVHIFLESNDVIINAITDADIELKGTENNDNYLTAIICVLLALLITLCGVLLPAEKNKEMLFLALLTLGISFPLLNSHVIIGHDTTFHMARMEGIYEGMRAGYFPVYISPNQLFGLGNISPTMYPSAVMYPFAMLRFANISLIVCYKLFVLFVNVLTVFLVQYVSKRIFRKETLSYMATFLYVFSTYRVTNIYVRGALGESLAMAFAPLALYGFYELTKGNYDKWVLLAIGMTGLLQTHVLSVMFYTGILVFETIYILVRDRFKCGRFLVAGIKAAIFTVGINAFFWVPFLCYSREDFYVFRQDTGYISSGVVFSQMFELFPNPNGINIANGTTAGEMPLSLGLTFFVGICIAVYCIYKKRTSLKEMSLMINMLIVSLITIYGMSWLFPAEAMSEIGIFEKITSSMQYAWRLGGIASLTLTVVTVSALDLLYEEKKEFEKPLNLVLCGLSLISAFYIFDVQSYLGDQDANKLALDFQSFTDSLYLYGATDESPEAVNKYNPSDYCISQTGNTKIEYSNYSRNGNRISVDVNVVGDAIETNEALVFPVYYYPGYSILINGEEAGVFSVNELAACHLNEREAHIDLFFRPKWYFKYANILSVLSILALSGYIFVSGRKRIANVA